MEFVDDRNASRIGSPKKGVGERVGSEAGGWRPGGRLLAAPAPGNLENPCFPEIASGAESQG